jgi:hypothetical protein
MKEPVVRTSRLAWVATGRGQATGSEWASRCRSTNMYATEEGNIPRVLDGMGVVAGGYALSYLTHVQLRPRAWPDPSSSSRLSGPTLVSLELVVCNTVISLSSAHRMRINNVSLSSPCHAQPGVSLSRGLPGTLPSIPAGNKLKIFATECYPSTPSQRRCNTLPDDLSNTTFNVSQVFRIQVALPGDSSVARTHPADPTLLEGDKRHKPEEWPEGPPV